MGPYYNSTTVVNTIKQEKTGNCDMWVSFFLNTIKDKQRKKENDGARSLSVSVFVQHQAEQV